MAQSQGGQMPKFYQNKKEGVLFLQMHPSAIHTILHDILGFDMILHNILQAQICFDLLRVVQMSKERYSAGTGQEVEANQVDPLPSWYRQSDIFHIETNPAQRVSYCDMIRS